MKQATLMQNLSVYWEVHVRVDGYDPLEPNTGATYHNRHISSIQLEDTDHSVLPALLPAMIFDSVTATLRTNTTLMP